MSLKRPSPDFFQNACKIRQLYSIAFNTILCRGKKIGLK